MFKELVALRCFQIGSVGSGFVAPVTFARGQQVKKLLASVRRVLKVSLVPFLL